MNANDVSVSDSVSIMIPVRNAEATLPLAIQSCLAQTLPDFELVLVDHGSIDRTFSIMKKHARRDSRIRVMKAPPGCGFISALNFLWHESHGALLARMDADDFAYNDRIQQQVRLMREQPELAACGTRVRIRRRASGHVVEAEAGYAAYQQWLKSLATAEAIARDRFIDSPLANPSMMIRRSVLEKFDGYLDQPWAEDYDLWLRLLGGGERIGKVDRLLLDWYDSGSRITRNHDRYSQKNFTRAKAHYLARLPQVGEQGVSICGAGPIGKRLARYLIAEGTEIHAFYEVSEKRIGQQIHGIEVRDGNFSFGEAIGTVLISAVGVEGGREKIRVLAGEAGFEEGADFFCVA